MSPRQKTLSRLQGWLNDDGAYFLRPWDIIKSYTPDMLRPDLMAGLTVAVVLLPQAIAYAMIAELPPQVGLYTAVVGAIFGALWGSSKFLQTGPTNASSLLVLATLLSVAQPGTPEFLAAAGFLAVITGVMKLVMGLARMGALVNFVSDSVVVGFTAGAGVLISVNQLRHLFRLDLVSRPVFRDTVVDLSGAMGTIHPESAALGIGTIGVILVLKHWRPRWPRALVGMVLAATITAVFGLDQRGVLVLGELPRSLPPFTSLPLLDFQLMGRLSAGALAITAIGLVEAVSISRSIAQRSGQRLNSNQEFVGQGLSNIVSGLFSGYAGSGSLTRSTLNYESGAKSPMAAVFSGLWVLLAVLLLAPLAVYLPRTALAAVLLATAYSMVDWAEIRRIFRSSRGDTSILFATLIATLVLPLEFAVLAGVMVSFGRFLMRTSMPTVGELSPDDTFSHLVPLRGRRPSCPQMGIVEIEGSLYFGAVNHVEHEMIRIRNRHPGQVFLLLRMKRVDHCDVSGIHMLEALVRRYRERGGDVYLTGVRRSVLHMMSVSGFLKFLGHENVLRKEDPLGHLFYNVLHPGICIYECDKRVFAECQALPKHDESDDAEHIEAISCENVDRIPPSEVIRRMKENPESLALVDVGERREFARWHIAGSFNIPLPQLTVCSDDIPRDRTVVLISRIGRRSTLAAHILHDQGFTDVVNLSGGMLGWEAAGHPLTVE
jgi:sulfate permease, SulP family